jgi:hypothetical protein
MAFQVHPLSRWTAKDFVQRILSDPHIQLPGYAKATLKRSFQAVADGKKGKGKILVSPPKALVLPTNVLENVNKWYPLIEAAAQTSNWYITTGTFAPLSMVQVDADKRFKILMKLPTRPAPSGPKTPPPKSPQRIDLTKEKSTSTKKADKPEPAAGTGHESDVPRIERKPSISQDFEDLGNIISVSPGTLGITIPPQSFRVSPGRPLYQDKRGVIVIVIDKRSDLSGKELTLANALLKKAKQSFGYSVLHEMIHAGIYDTKDSDIIGHCHPAFDAMDDYFDQDYAKLSCMKEKIERAVQESKLKSRAPQKVKGQGGSLHK